MALKLSLDETGTASLELIGAGETKIGELAVRVTFEGSDCVAENVKVEEDGEGLRRKGQVSEAWESAYASSTYHLLDSLGSVRVLADREFLELVDKCSPLGDESGEGSKVRLFRHGDLGDEGVELPDEMGAKD